MSAAEQGGGGFMQVSLNDTWGGRCQKIDQKRVTYYLMVLNINIIFQIFQAAVEMRIRDELPSAPRSAYGLGSPALAGSLKTRNGSTSVEQHSSPGPRLSRQLTVHKTWSRSNPGKMTNK